MLLVFLAKNIFPSQFSQVRQIHKVLLYFMKLSITDISGWKAGFRQIRKGTQILWTKGDVQTTYLYQRWKALPCGDDDAFWGRVLSSWWMIQKPPVKSHYCAKPIFHKSLDIEIIVWTPIQSRGSVIERLNLKHHALWSPWMASGGWCAPLVQVRRNCWAMFALTGSTALAPE